MARLKASFAGERRTSHFSLQLTPTERAELERRAQKRGVVIAEFVRACCFVNPGKETDTPRRGTRDSAAVAIVAELGRVGNNLNQLAKHANETGLIDDQAALRETITELKAALGRIV
jgi:hypothetical protein